MLEYHRAPAIRKPLLDDDEEGATNTGSNLFVTGIHPRLNESDISRLFEKYGDVDNCSIMFDPHTKESRGFGFVNMSNSEQADAAKEGLQGEVIEGRTLSIEKARRSRPRTPTPGKYFGPPKRGKSSWYLETSIKLELMSLSDGRGPRRDDRRGGYGGGGLRRRDDGYDRYGRYDSYDRGRDYGGRDYRRDYRDDYRGGSDRYGGGREDRYSRDERRDDRRGEDRRAYYDRDANPPTYDAAPPREPRDAFAGRSYERTADDRGQRW